MNQRILPVGFFFVLLLSSLFSLHHSYCSARDIIQEDLTQALASVVEDIKEDLVKQDTIKAYRKLQLSSDTNMTIVLSDKRFCARLKNKNLRDKSFLTLSIVDEIYKDTRLGNNVISGDTLFVESKVSGEIFALRGYSRLSVASVLLISDQRISCTLAFMAVLWLALYILFFRKKYSPEKLHVFPDGTVSVNAIPDNSGLSYSEIHHSFMGKDNTPIHLTPMQEQLITMFWNSPTHTLSKEEICSALWPKKDNANETLYTLIKRLKPVIEDNTNMKITSDRGKSYSLVVRELSDAGTFVS